MKHDLSEYDEYSEQLKRQHGCNRLVLGVMIAATAIVFILVFGRMA